MIGYMRQIIAIAVLCRAVYSHHTKSYRQTPMILCMFFPLVFSHYEQP